MKWTVHGERTLYDSPWVRLSLVDVEVPGIRRYEHHVVRSADAAAVLVFDPDRGVLLVWRHRFISNRWGWELPGGMVDTDETPAQAAARECIEETGWRPTGALVPTGPYQPVNGLSDQTFFGFIAQGAEQVGAFDPAETDRVEWVSIPRFRELVAANELRDGLSYSTALAALAFHPAFRGH